MSYSQNTWQLKIEVLLPHRLGIHHSFPECIGRSRHARSNIVFLSLYLERCQRSIQDNNELAFTFPGFFPLSSNPPLATALPIARFPPVAPVLAWTVLSLNDSPSFWSSNRSSSSVVISRRFLHFSVNASDSCRARSYRVASSFVYALFGS